MEGSFMNLRRRLQRLEQHRGPNGNIEAVALDLPDGSNLVCYAGQWVPSDPSTVLAILEELLVQHLPVKLYRGFDPREI
jgi:hypothetical protein